VHAYLPTAHRHDQDNLLAWLKCTIDGCTDAGLFSDDRELAYLPSVQTTDKKRPRIEIKAVRGRIKNIQLEMEDNDL